MLRSLAHECIPALKPSDTVEKAQELIHAFHVRHLPVVDDSGKLVGVVSEDQLLDAEPHQAVEALITSQQAVSIDAESHTMDATRLMLEHRLTTLPVVEGESEYVGLLDRHQLFEIYARLLAVQEPGVILVVEMQPQDYSLGQLAYLIEQNGAHIRSVFTEPPGREGESIRVTLKLDVTDSARIRHVLEHYGYHVVAAFSDVSTDEDFQQRIQAFMRFLEV